MLKGAVGEGPPPQPHADQHRHPEAQHGQHGDREAEALEAVHPDGRDRADRPDVDREPRHPAQQLGPQVGGEAEALRARAGGVRGEQADEVVEAPEHRDQRGLVGEARGHERDQAPGEEVDRAHLGDGRGERLGVGGGARRRCRGGVAPVRGGRTAGGAPGRRGRGGVDPAEAASSVHERDPGEAAADEAEGREGQAGLRPGREAERLPGLAHRQRLPRALREAEGQHQAEPRVELGAQQGRGEHDEQPQGGLRHRYKGDRECDGEAARGPVPGVAAGEAHA
ncbi:MAG: hypothetical protein ACK559_18675, partial [bacterium]